jgi:hypothetical protein
MFDFRTTVSNKNPKKEETNFEFKVITPSRFLTKQNINGDNQSDEPNTLDGLLEQNDPAIRDAQFFSSMTPKANHNLGKGQQLGVSATSLVDNEERVYQSRDLRSIEIFSPQTPSNQILREQCTPSAKPCVDPSIIPLLKDNGDTIRLPDLKLDLAYLQHLKLQSSKSVQSGKQNFPHFQFNMPPR